MTVSAMMTRTFLMGISSCLLSVKIKESKSHLVNNTSLPQWSANLKHSWAIDELCHDNESFNMPNNVCSLASTCSVMYMPGCIVLWTGAMLYLDKQLILFFTPLALPLWCHVISPMGGNLWTAPRSDRQFSTPWLWWKGPSLLCKKLMQLCQLSLLLKPC